MLKIMTPGPTQVRENVRQARSQATTNPDLDAAFFDFYKETCSLLSGFFHTSNAFYLLGGEGILGLEAACASLTEKGDRVLVIDNGIFGEGFRDFVSMYGGTAVMYCMDRFCPIDVKKLKTYLDKDSNFKYATVVHCDTPSGVLNDVQSICSLLHSYGILSVVDSVSASFGTPLSVDEGEIDILCGGSQKALSAPPGLTFLGVSERAMQVVLNRRTPVASFYANIANFKEYYEKKWFPYTMPVSDIYGFRMALLNVLEDREIFQRHDSIAKAVRNALVKAGLTLHLKDGYSPTVTVMNVPEGLQADAILRGMLEKYQIMIAGCFGELAGKVLRIGHMGENANITDVAQTLFALEETLFDLGFACKCSLNREFYKCMQ